MGFSEVYLVLSFKFNVIVTILLLVVSFTTTILDNLLYLDYGFRTKAYFLISSSNIYDHFESLLVK